jgi:hypothetical protein
MLKKNIVVVGCYYGALFCTLILDLHFGSPIIAPPFWTTLQNVSLQNYNGLCAGYPFGVIMKKKLGWQDRYTT